MPASPLHLFKALADDTRLRVLRCLGIAELSVAELVAVLGLPQSTVSRHLKPLREAALVETRRDGTSVYYRRGKAFSDPALKAILDARLSDLPSAATDRSAVRRMLDQRKTASRDYFDRMAGKYGSLIHPGGGFEPLATALCAGFAGRDIADLGAGEGYLTLQLARYARHVHAVDHSPKMLRHLESAAAAAGLQNVVTALQGDLERVPLPDRCVDAVFLSQALHHAAEPGAAVQEAARLLRPGGLLVLLDLARHEQEWVRERFADQWLGFEPDQLSAWVRQAGCDVVRSETLSGSTPELPVLVLVALRKPTQTEKGKTKP